MWTDENRGRYDRSQLRYPSDLTDEEWALIVPSIPPAKRGGNKRTVDVRSVVNGVMYILSTGCQWAQLPKDLPPRSTVNDYFKRWEHDGTLTRIHHAALREVPGDGRPAGEPDRRHHRQPKRQERRKGGRSIDPAGFDAGKKIKGKKRNLLVDTQGLLMQAIVHAADIQDRDGGVLLMSSLLGLFPFLLKLYADSGDQGPKFQQGLPEVCRPVNVEIVKRSELGKFVVLPKRWIVERTIGWLNRCRRLAKDWECLNRNGLTFLRWASVRLMVRKLCQTAS